MINPLSHTPQITQNRFQAGAVKVFEEANGSTDMFVAGQGDLYEDLASDFLANWLVTDSAPLFAASNETAAPSAPAQEPEVPVKSEPSFTQFSLGLDWNVADLGPRA